MLDVGKDLFAMCGKCDAEWHVIVAMDGGKVTKVQCKQCMGYHRYRVPPGELDVNRNAAATRRIAAPKTRKNGKATASTTSVTKPNARPVQPYKMTGSYEPGDRIAHPKFGEGVVESCPTESKMLVTFQTGRRILAQGKTG